MHMVSGGTQRKQIHLVLLAYGDEESCASNYLSLAFDLSSKNGGVHRGTSSPLSVEICCGLDYEVRTPKKIVRMWKSWVPGASYITSQVVGC